MLPVTIQNCKSRLWLERLQNANKNDAIPRKTQDPQRVSRAICGTSLCDGLKDKDQSAIDLRRSRRLSSYTSSAKLQQKLLVCQLSGTGMEALDSRLLLPHHIGCISHATLHCFLQISKIYTCGNTQQLVGAQPAILTPSSDNCSFNSC